MVGEGRSWATQEKWRWFGAVGTGWGERGGECPAWGRSLRLSHIPGGQNSPWKYWARRVPPTLSGIGARQNSQEQNASGRPWVKPGSVPLTHGCPVGVPSLGNRAHALTSEWAAHLACCANPRIPAQGTKFASDELSDKDCKIRDKIRLLGNVTQTQESRELPFFQVSLRINKCV